MIAEAPALAKKKWKHLIKDFKFSYLWGWKILNKASNLSLETIVFLDYIKKAHSYLRKGEIYVQYMMPDNNNEQCKR